MNPLAKDQERVLRQLFWQLMFRGRSARHRQDHQGKKKLGVGLQVGLLALFGILPALLARRFETLAFATSLHTFTFLFAALTLAADAGGMLFQREEAEILLHRPVAPRTLLRAKVQVLLRFALLLALALNLAGMATGAFTPDGVPWFALAHSLSTLLLMLFAASVVVLAYNACLRWFGRERFDTLLTTMQTLLAIVMVAGSQAWPRLIALDGTSALDASGWAAALPPVWFGALDGLLCGTTPLAAAWLPATLGIVATAITGWLAFDKLGNAYGTGLQAMNEAVSGDSDRPRRRWLAALAERAPLAWWLRSPAERQAFVLATAYLARDRTTKLRLYPAVAPILVLPLLWALTGRDDSQSVLCAVGIGYAALAPHVALGFLQRSDQWQAADLFRYAPVPHWAPLFHGARKAVLTWLGFPAVTLVGTVLVLVTGSAAPLWPTASLLLALGPLTTLSGFTKEWLPLSLPTQNTPNAGTGCLTAMLSIGPAMAIAAGAQFANHLGFAPVFLGAVAVVAPLAQIGVVRTLAARPWQQDRRRQ